LKFAEYFIESSEEKNHSFSKELINQITQVAENLYLSKYKKLNAMSGEFELQKWYVN